ncbi:MAG: AarF/ABC1/UbiB kinase family protein [Halobacteria archaeon]|nr:AarF/ABC1/UbiB kinase family protein [Halobacteria archaeon]
MLRFYWRFVRVVFQFLPLAVEYLRDRRKYILFGASREVSPETQRRRARRLLDSFITLGPAYIKVGQILSTRPDVVPMEYIDVLTELQDTVPPAPYERASHVVEEDIGDPHEVFEEFDEEAISGASLGQVHTAEYKGDKVAVKVRRPNVEEIVNTDLRVIGVLLPFIKPFVSEARAYSLQNMADEFSRIIHEEMDYEREAMMLSEIRSNFSENPEVVIPEVYDELSTDRILTLEYVDGAKITEVDQLEAMGVDPSRVARDLEKTYLKMALVDGVFHGDPHPGNLAVDEEGRIVIYDFGMSGRIDSAMQSKIVDFYISVADRDPEGIVDSLIDLGTLDPDVNKETMISIIELVIKDLEGEEIDEWRVQEIIGEVEGTIYEFPFRLPPNMALIMRVATVVEGVCLQLDPDFNFIDVATEFLTEKGFREEGVRRFADEIRGDIQDTFRATVNTPVKLENALDKIERNSLEVRTDLRDSAGHFESLGRRLSLSILTGASIIGGAILSTVDLLYGGLMFVLSAVFLFLLVLSFRKTKGLSAKPQFTRQEMRKK